MNTERPEENREPQVTINLAVSPDTRNESDAPGAPVPPAEVTSSDAARNQATREESSGARKESRNSKTSRPGKDESPASQVSKTKLDLQSCLPALKDDADVGVQKEHVVTRDGKADLRFAGVLLASAAPATVPEGRWQELRVYQTEGGKHVFSRVTRNVLEKETDVHEGEIFDPTPSSVPSQLMRSAREMARQRQLTWMDAAVGFFGYDPLAKTLYRKLSVNFEERIS
jgi:hypothetical protein